MNIHLALDEHLLQQALRIGRQRTEKAVVTEALEEYVQRRQQREIVRLSGVVEYGADFDYKSQRKHA